MTPTISLEITLRTLLAVLPILERDEYVARVLRGAALHSNAASCNSPERFVDGRGLVQIDLRESLRDRIGGLAGVVVRDSAVDVMGDMRGADAVVKPVDHWRIWPIDGVESAAHIRELGCA
eukprot:CAMPEP_0115851480 /NCGR_PEP_ID=MMETSP0287-20121206/12504_1 /TAXON_ID=412157 /ORGANISM="Chrysochromulina rotalis, Strain UIO044" /LENGTH=120 /DNA_ID=CAMNT_0003305515 /DNA_START=308 /DNA_END=670 /DNA_ORIENTATION=-